MSVLTDKYPLPRSLGKGMHGNDVFATQDAMRRWGVAKRPKTEAGVRRSVATGNWGAPTTAQVKHFQKLHAVPQSGVIGTRTWNLLLPFMTATDLGFAKRAFENAHPFDSREAIRNAMYNAYTHRYSIAYVQVRPARWARTHTVDADELSGEDCSSISSWAYYVAHKGDAKIVDPGGYNWSGYGNTDSMIANRHGRWVKHPRVGDLAHYTRPGHVAVVTEVSSRGIFVISNGHHPMAHLPYNYGHAFLGFRDYINE